MVDTRSDVYTLGAVLYELLTGAAPTDADTLRGISLQELCRLVREQSPPRPSARSKAPVAAQLRGELDWITMKALEKEPARRYQSAADLASDIERFLSNRPVTAGPPSAKYRARKFVQRHRAAVAMSAVVVLAMVVATAVSLMQASRARRAERLAIDQAERARAAERLAIDQAEQARRELAKYTSIARFSQQILTSIDPRVARGRDVSLLRDVLDGASKRADEALADQPEVAQAIQNTLGYAYFAIGDSQRALHHNQRAYELAEQNHGADDLRTLHALGNVWPLQMDLGQLEQAERNGLKLLAAYDRTGHGHTAEAMSCLSNLASLYIKLDRPSDALPLLERAVEGRQQLFGEGPETFASMNNLAMAYNRLGQDDRARQLWQTLLQRQRQHLGNDHPQTLATVGNLANVLQELGDRAAAEPLFREAFDGKRRILPQGHPSRLITEMNFANFLMSSGKLDEAAEIFQQAYDDAVNAVGPDDERRITLAMWVAEARRRQKRYDGAAPLAEEAWQRFNSQFGESDTRTLQAAATRLALACDTENLVDARRVLEAIKPALEGAPIGSASVAANVFYNAARAAQLLGQPDVARQRIEQARRRIHGIENHLLRERIDQLAAELGLPSTSPSR
jgi:tetratricopeptide (TPR) repeat protein